MFALNCRYIDLVQYFRYNLSIRARQLDSVAPLVRALHRNRRAAGSIPAREDRRFNSCQRVYIIQ